MIFWSKIETINKIIARVKIPNSLAYSICNTVHIFQVRFWHFVHCYAEKNINFQTSLFFLLNCFRRELKIEEEKSLYLELMSYVCLCLVFQKIYDLNLDVKPKVSIEKISNMNIVTSQKRIALMANYIYIMKLTLLLTI